MYRRRNVVSVPDMPDDKKFVENTAYDRLSCIAECFGTIKYYKGGLVRWKVFNLNKKKNNFK